MCFGHIMFKACQYAMNDMIANKISNIKNLCVSIVHALLLV
jgi:hypothetical protein